MYERTTTQGMPSIPTWETLHVWLRGQVQGLIQRVLEEEVREFLGRERYQRRAEVGGVQGYRNGYGKPRKLSTPVGVVEVRRPRVRGLEQRFESRILPLFARRTKTKQRGWISLIFAAISSVRWTSTVNVQLIPQASGRKDSIAAVRSSEGKRSKRSTWCPSSAPATISSPSGSTTACGWNPSPELRLGWMSKTFIVPRGASVLIIPQPKDAQGVLVTVPLRRRRTKDHQVPGGRHGSLAQDLLVLCHTPLWSGVRILRYARAPSHS